MKASKKLTILCLFFSIAFTVSIVGCAADKSEEGDTPKTPRSYEQLNDDSLSPGFLIAVLDDSVIYSDYDALSGQKADITVRRRYAEDGKIIDIGTVENYIAGRGQHAVFEDSLYFHITTAVTQSTALQNEENENLLLKIDLKTNSLSTVLKESEYLPGANMSQLDDETLVFCQTKRNEDKSTTRHMELFDIDTGKVTHKSEEYHESSGAELQSICSYNGEIYVLVIGKSGASIKVFDDEFNELRTINIDAVKATARQQINRMEIYDDYIFMSSGAYSFLGKISDDKVTVIKESDTGSFASAFSWSEDGKIPVFYEKNTDIYYLFDSKTDTLVEKKLNIPKDTHITTIQSCDEKVYLDISPDDLISGLEFLPHPYYIVDRDELETAEFLFDVDKIAT